MKTKIIFKGSVWRSYYTEVNLKALKEELGKEFMDASDLDNCLNTIIIDKQLWPDDIIKLIDFLKEKEVWNHIALLSINVEE